jgi:hypothetical protein
LVTLTSLQTGIPLEEMGRLFGDEVPEQVLDAGQSKRNGQDTSSPVGFSSKVEEDRIA